MASANGNRPPDIITYLSAQLGHILAEYLTNPDVEIIDSAKNKLLKNNRELDERLYVKILLTLSNPKNKYMDQLLFKDYQLEYDDLWTNFVLGNNQSKRIYSESMTYVQDLMLKPLKVIAKHGSSPTNMHHLFAMLCKFSLDKKWIDAYIKRSKEPAPDINEAFFNQIAIQLKELCKTETNGLSAISKKIRDDHGILYLTTNINRAETPEELSLLKVFNVVPKPLNTSIKNPDYFSLLESILLSLNERYGLLRACGLPPNDFQYDANLSIGKLRELKKLRQVAEGYLTTRLMKNRKDAYQQAFTDLLNNKHTEKLKKTETLTKEINIAGFKNFFEFEGDKVGFRMLLTPIEPFNTVDPIGITDPLGPIDTDIIDDTLDSEILKISYEDFLKKYSSSFSPITQYVYVQVLIEERPLNGADSVLNDREFRQLLATDIEFANLDTKQLLKALEKQLGVIFLKHSDDNDNPLKQLSN